MILEDATHEAFGYWPKDLKQKSAKNVLSACETCGKFRVTPKHGYRVFCKQCSSKGVNFTKEILLKHGLKGDKNGNYSGGKVNHICEYCYKLVDVYESKSRNGRGVFCSKTCLINSQRAENNPNFKGGRKVSIARAKARRNRDFGYNILMPLNSGEAGHHVTNEYVIGIPERVHQKLGGGISTEKHRNRILLWLKENDQRKYETVLSVLAKESFE